MRFGFPSSARAGLHTVTAGEPDRRAVALRDGPPGVFPTAEGKGGLAPLSLARTPRSHAAGKYVLCLRSREPRADHAEHEIGREAERQQ